MRQEGKAKGKNPYTQQDETAQAEGLFALTAKKNTIHGTIKFILTCLNLTSCRTLTLSKSSAISFHTVTNSPGDIS